MIYTLGESLMDVITTYDGITVSKPGGSMLNVSVSLGRAGKDVSLISEIGDDETGDQLIAFLHKNGVNTDYVTTYRNCQTSKALARLDENSKPSYTFQKAYPANRSLAKPPIYAENDILILGSMYSRDPEIENDLNAHLTAAKRGGALIVYDPNVRHSHHLMNAVGKAMLLRNLAYAHIIKGSDEDFSNIFHVSDVGLMKDELFKINRAALIIVTLGAKGSASFYRDESQYVRADKIDLLSTVGAGDAFTAGVVKSIFDQGIQKEMNNLSKAQILKMMIEGTQFASLVCKSMDNYIP